MTLTEAKDIARVTAILLPLIRARDKISINHLRETARAANAVLQNRKATDAEKIEAQAALDKVQALMPATIAQAEQLSADALQQLKKRTPPNGDLEAIRLAPRRVRREAARVVAKEERRLARSRAET